MIREGLAYRLLADEHLLLRSPVRMLFGHTERNMTLHSDCVGDRETEAAAERKGRAIARAREMYAAMTKISLLRLLDHT